MSKILIIAEHTNDTANASTAKCIQCATEIPNAEIDVAVFSDNGESVANEIAKMDGVTKVIRIEHDANSNPMAALIAPQVISISKGYAHIFGPSTTFGKDLMPRVAALMDVNQISDVMEILDSHKFKQPIYAGNAIVTVEAPTTVPVVATVRIASYRAVGSSGSAQIESAELDIDLPSHSKFIGIQAATSDRPDLQTAAKVVSGGRALGSEENFEIIYDLADSFGAGVGASRAAVDAGYVPNEMQVGQTGKIIAPDLYIAIGISGAIQHLTGIKDAGTIVAINKDAEAPIFEVADIGLVGDLFDVVPELKAALG